MAKITAQNTWNLKRLQEYIGTEETESMDFKSSVPLTRSPNEVQKFVIDLTTHVSAFLNGAGGTLVVGIEENRSKSDFAGELSAGVPRSKMQRDKLHRMICDRIHPAVADYINVYTVKVGENVIDNENIDDLLAYVIEVRPGVTAYQASDKKYYLRTGSNSLAMEDKDIRLRMFALQKPMASVSVEVDYKTDLTLHRNIKKLKEDGKDFYFNPTQLFIAHISIRNVGLVSIRECLLDYKFEVNKDDGYISLSGGSDQEYLNFRLETDRNNVPIFPGHTRKVKSLQMSVYMDLQNAKINPDDYVWEIKVFHDNAPPTVESFNLYHLAVQAIKDLEAEVDRL